MLEPPAAAAIRRASQPVLRELSPSGGLRSPPCRWRRPARRRARARRCAIPIPISRNWRRRMLALWPGSAIHARWICAGGARGCRCPRRCSRRATSRGRARSRCRRMRSDHVGPPARLVREEAARRPCRRSGPRAARRSFGVLPAAAASPCALRSRLCRHSTAARTRPRLPAAGLQRRVRALRRARARQRRPRRPAARRPRRLPARRRAAAWERRSGPSARVIGRRTRIPITPPACVDARSGARAMIPAHVRGVAQPGSAPALGAGVSSGRPDLNRRSQRPKRCAITRLRHAPDSGISMVRPARAVKHPSRRLLRLHRASRRHRCQEHAQTAPRRCRPPRRRSLARRPGCPRGRGGPEGDLGPADALGREVRLPHLQRPRGRRLPVPAGLGLRRRDPAGEPDRSRGSGLQVVGLGQDRAYRGARLRDVGRAAGRARRPDGRMATPARTAAPARRRTTRTSSPPRAASSRPWTAG